MNAHDLLLRETGMDLAPAVVERALASRMAACASVSGDAYLANITPAELSALIELVVVPESWMFREPEAFVAAATFARRRLAFAPGRILRCLSVPCAGGEEPYTLAMALLESGLKAQDFQIDAIDLSAVAIERARRGRYTRNAFRGGDQSFRERFFTRDGNDFQIDDALRTQVNFAQGNLLAFDVSFQAGRYDVIFCRNLLIYFDEPSTAMAIGRLDTLLATDGVLFAGYAEVPAFTQNGFAPLRVPGAFALEKKKAKEAVRKPVHGTDPARGDCSPMGEQSDLRRESVMSPVSRRRAGIEAASNSTPTHQRPKPGTDPIRGQSPTAPAVAATPTALLDQARRLSDHGDFPGATAACKAALALDPHSAQAYFILGMVSECREDKAAAGEYWRRCVYLQPDHYDALCHLALLEGQDGNQRQAASYRQRAARVWQRHNGKADA
jgi:chemotaxis protein methyltransferase WspC